MANLPKKRCSYNFCRNYATKEGRCKEHIVTRETHVDPFYKTARWLHVSKGYLAKHPLCRKCEQNGRAEPATSVDHIVPRKKAPDLAWKSQNWAPLCHSCHGLKRSYEHAGRELEFYEVKTL